jgi:hypothetical protein
MKRIAISVVAVFAVLSAVDVRAAALSPSTPFTVPGAVLSGLASPSFAASLAWAGEDETFSKVDLRLLNASDEDARIIVPHPAPEPPAVILAGMAVSGVFCGRSLLRRKRSATEGTA